jgi:NhaA family Na+:H+ antiporter
VRAWLGAEGFVKGLQSELAQLTTDVTPKDLSAHELAPRLRHVDVARREALSPAESLIERLHPWVAFGIMPIFALANAGVSVSGFTLEGPSWSVATGATLGLLLGKPVGVVLAIGIALKLGIGTLPLGLTFRHLTVLGVVAGVGFTMALFIAQLAFSDAKLLAAAKLGVLAASGLAAVAALVLGRLLLTHTTTAGVAQSADEAESSTIA